MSKSKLAFLSFIISMLLISAIAVGSPIEINPEYKHLESGETSSTIKGKCGQDYILVTPSKAETWLVNITVQSEWQNQSIHIHIYEAVGAYPYNYESQTEMPDARGIGEASLVTYLNTSKSYEVWIRDGYARAFTGEIREYWGSSIANNDFEESSQDYIRSKWRDSQKIDGIAKSSEWDGFTDITLHFIDQYGINKWDITDKKSKIAVTNNETTLFLSIILPDDYVNSEYDSDHLYLEIDSNSGFIDRKWKTLTYDSSEEWNSLPNVNDGYKSAINSSIRGIDYQDGGSSDGLCSRRHSNTTSGADGYYTYEFMIPFRSITHDKYDIDAEVGDTLTITVTFAEGRDGFFNYWKVKFSTVLVSQGSKWLMFHGDLANTGYVEEEVTPPLTLLWKKWMDSGEAHPVVAYGKIYVGSHNDHLLYAFDSETGDTLWSFDLSKDDGLRRPVKSAVAVSQNIVVVNSWDNIVFALDSETGSLIWKYKSDYPIFDTAQSGYFIHPSPVIVNDTVYIGLGDGYMHAIKLHTGEPVWTLQTEAIIKSTPAYYSGVLFFGNGQNRGPYDPYFYAVNASNGEIIWKYNKGGTRVVSSPSVNNGLVFFGANDKFYALDIYDGTQQWVYEVHPRSSIHSSPAVSNENFVFFTDSDYSWEIPKGNIYALDALTGEEIWVKEGYFGYISPIITGDVLYLGELHTPERKSSIYAINISDGETLWSYKTDGVVDSIPAPYGNRLYISPVDGYLYCFEETTLILDDVVTSSTRCEVGSTQKISVHFTWEYNREDAASQKIAYNQKMYVTDSEGWINIEYTKNEVGAYTCSFENLSSKYDIDIEVDSPTIHFDKVIIDIPSSQHVGIGEGFSWSGVYASDNSPFTGSLILNNTALPLFYTEKVKVSVLGIIDPIYGISSFEAADSFELIYDTISFNLTIQAARIDVGSVPNLAVNGIYMYDETRFQGQVEATEPLEHYGKSEITIIDVVDSKYGLNVFECNTVECIWDTIQIIDGGVI